MDISVRHLNKRMALQIPTEFPLGLVFVVGDVKADPLQVEGEPIQEFFLMGEEHAVYCKLSDRALEEISLNPGDRIRAGGHVLFDTARAQYCLFARDVEILREYRPPTSALGEIAAVSHEKAVTELPPAILPKWVRELAPPEIQEEWAARRLAEAEGTLVLPEKTKEVGEEEQAPEPVAVDSWQEFVADDGSMDYVSAEPPLAELSDELIEFLSEAIDSNDLVEITPDVLAEFASTQTKEPEPPPEEEPAEEITRPDPEQVYKTQAASIEEFLSALEKAIASDETETDADDAEAGKDLDPAIESDSEQRVDAKGDSTGQTEIDESEGAEDEVPVATDIDPDAEPSGEAGLKTVISDQPDPVIDYDQLPQKRSRTPWYVVLLIILAVVLFVAILVVVAIGNDIIPSTLFQLIPPNNPFLAN